MKAIIVGAGIAGIATAVRLATKGIEVVVFEANSYAGGKLSEIKLGKFRFDAGPSLFTMPHFVEELFLLAGKDPKAHFSYQKMDESCRYFYPDGTSLTAFSDQKLFAQEVEQKLGVHPKRTLRALADSSEIYQLTAPVFLEKSLHKRKTYWSKKVFKALGKLGKLDLFSTMHSANVRKLRNQKLVQLFDRYATYNGSNPYKAPGVLNVIPHLEHNVGTFFPEGGMFQITKSLVELAQSLGVKFHFNAPVKQILIEKKQAKGVLLNDQTIEKADIVVSNMDIVPTYRRLLPDQKAPEKTLKQERSSSALIFYWAIEGTFEQLGLHNILFTQDYKAEFESIFDDKKIYEDPTVYIHISSKAAPKDAPQGCENWFVMINVPANYDQNWFMIKAFARQAILEKVQKVLGTDVRLLIREEEILDPILIEQKTSSYRGALYGASSNGRFSAFLRHPNFSSALKNLYFVGGSVHPGGGIPLCLLSAKITSELIVKKHKLG